MISLAVLALMHAVLCCVFQALAFPSQLYEIIFELATTKISIRLYGGAMLSMSSFSPINLNPTTSDYGTILAQDLFLVLNRLLFLF